MNKPIELTPDELKAIEREAEESCDTVSPGRHYCIQGYIAAATAATIREREKAGKLVDAAELVIRRLTGINDHVTEDVIKILSKPLNQYKSI